MKRYVVLVAYRRIGSAALAGADTATTIRATSRCERRGRCRPGDGRASEEWGRLTSRLLAQYRRLDLVEDALGDAVEAAARHWPADGPPDNPPAWLLTAARRRVLDRLRAESMAHRKATLLEIDAEQRQAALGGDGRLGDLVEDDALRLVLMCTPPSLATEAAGIPFAVPAADVLPQRLDTVAQTAYLAFTACYAPGSGPDLLRADLAARRSGWYGWCATCDRTSR